MQSDNGKLFVGGISWDTNEERLKEYFSNFGEVIEAVIMKDRATGRARGFGFVVFADLAVAERVIKEKHNIDGRMVEAKKAVPRDDQSIINRNNTSSFQGSPGPGRTRKIFVGGLASTVTESDFKRYFEQFGTTIDVVVMYDHNTKRPRGFGFITYNSEEAVEKVLLKTFHELNGKMVEVKRAVPKELSPGPSCSALGGYSYSVNRVNNLLNGHAQGYNPGSTGGYGLRIDSRFSPVAGGRSGFAPFGSGYGMNVNFEQGLPTGFTGAANFSGNVNYGRGLSPYYIGNTNRFGAAVGYDGGNGGSSSFFSSVTRDLWGNDGHIFNNASNTSSNAYVGSASANILGSALGSSGVNLGPRILGENTGNSIPNNNLSFGYGFRNESSFGLGKGTYGRNIVDSTAPASSFSAASATNNGYDAAFAEFYGGGAVYSDPTRRSSMSEKDGSDPFVYGIGGASPDVSPGYVGAGGYSVNKRQSNRGIA